MIEGKKGLLTIGGVWLVLVIIVTTIYVWRRKSSPKDSHDMRASFVVQSSQDMSNEIYEERDHDFFRRVEDLLVWSFAVDSVRLRLVTGDAFVISGLVASLHQKYPLMTGSSPFVSRHPQERLITNGPIYDVGPRLLGLVIQDGVVHRPLNRDEGQGNFFLQPNGVLYLTKRGEWGMLPRDSFAFFYPEGVGIHFAFQAGPMMLISGRINSYFNPGSDNRRVRNALCLDDEGMMYHVFVSRPITLYAMASQMKRLLGCVDALYLDGEISGYHDSESRHEGTGPYFTWLVWER